MYHINVDVVDYGRNSSLCIHNNRPSAPSSTSLLMMDRSARDGSMVEHKNPSQQLYIVSGPSTADTIKNGSELDSAKMVMGACEVDCIKEENDNEFDHSDEEMDDELRAALAAIEKMEHEADREEEAVLQQRSATTVAASAPKPLSLYEELVKHQQELEGGELRRDQSGGSMNSDDDMKPAALPPGVYRKPFSRKVLSQISRPTRDDEEGEEEVDGDGDSMNHPEDDSSEPQDVHPRHQPQHDGYSSDTCDGAAVPTSLPSRAVSEGNPRSRRIHQQDCHDRQGDDCSEAFASTDAHGLLSREDIEAQRRLLEKFRRQKNQSQQQQPQQPGRSRRNAGHSLDDDSEDQLRAEPDRHSNRMVRKTNQEQPSLPSEETSCIAVQQRRVLARIKSGRELGGDDDSERPPVSSQSRRSLLDDGEDWNDDKNISFDDSAQKQLRILEKIRREEERKQLEWALRMSRGDDIDAEDVLPHPTLTAARAQSDCISHHYDNQTRTMDRRRQHRLLASRQDSEPNLFVSEHPQQPIRRSVRFNLEDEGYVDDVRSTNRSRNRRTQRRELEEPTLSRRHSTEGQELEEPTLLRRRSSGTTSGRRKKKLSHRLVNCEGCDLTLQAPADCRMVLCPTCGVLTPV